VALIVAAMAASIVAPAAAHPQDGPHADVRIRLDDAVLRWNIGLNLAYMDEIVDVGRERLDAVAPIEEEILRDAVLEHLIEDNRVVIDGVEIRPEVRIWALNRGDPTMIGLFPRSGMRGLIRAEIVLEYPHAGDPQHMEMTWADFPMDVLSAELEGGSPAPLVLQALFQAEGIVTQIEFSEGQRTVDWHATGQTIDDRLMPVPDLAEAIAMFGSAPAGPVGPVGPVADITAATPATATATATPAPPAQSRPAGGRAIPLVAMVLGVIGLGTAMIASLPRRTAAGRVIGGFLAIGFCAAAGWTAVLGPTVVWSEGGTPPPSMLARASDAGSAPAPARARAAGPPAVTSAACVAVFHPLLMNVYTAFDYSEESDVYDALARSVDGDLLDALYRRINRGLVMDDHDRAIARVTGVELLSTEVADPSRALTEDRFDVTARWRVDGTVVHWGHAHIRINEYAARYAVARTARGWRIVDQVILEQTRIPNPNDPLEQGVTAGLPRGLEL
jgi:hypothetical protein